MEPKKAGRPKGSPNKITAGLRELVKDITSGYFDTDNFKNDLAALEPKDRASIMLKLLDFSLPKLRSIEMKPSQDQVQRIINLGEGEPPEEEKERHRPGKIEFYRTPEVVNR